MSEGNVPPRKNNPDSMDSAARADQTPAYQFSNAPGGGDWEIVPLAGMPALGDEFAEGMSPPSLPHGNREIELHGRIQDLNRCNEVLLTRVHQLEEALERSQQARQQEAERSQRMTTTEEKVAAAQSHSVAELLRDLEQSNAALERQTILAETLSAQLQTFQERSEQLEHECATLRQQYSEKTRQWQVAEETCADLRSRLQRQQRYTLQFKAALEKCLDTHAFHHTSNRIEGESAPSSSSVEASAAHLNPLVMPRSERIQPWSASEAATQADPQLLSLMRSQPSPLDSEPAASATQPFPTSLGEVTPTAAASTPSAPEARAVEANREAEQQLWQDVERVVDTTAKAAQEEAAAESTPVGDQASANGEAAQFTEPIPWGAPVQKETLDEAAGAATEAAAEPEPMSPDGPTNERPTPAARRSPTPSGEDPVPPYSRMAETFPPAVAATSIPALEAMQTAQASPSPVVYPLKPTQRKRKSLSAVELPSFPPLPKVNN